MDLSALVRQLRPCDMDSPFVFLSYSSADRDTVWADALELQHRGYNVWIDEANLDKTKASWKEDALRAIENFNCALLLFYVSRASLTSEPCLNELERTAAQSTLETHLGKVDFIAVDAEPVGNMGAFIARIRDETERSQISTQEKSRKTRVLYRFMTGWFPGNNEKVRIHPKAEPGRIGDYYEDLERELERCRRELKLPPEKLLLRFSPERLYREAVACLGGGKPRRALGLLEAVADGYAPAALLLSHLYFRGTPEIPPEPQTAREIWDAVAQYIPSEAWQRQGTEYDAEKFYSEALAYYLAHGDRHGDGESLFLAGKMWIKKGSQPQAAAALRLAADLGSDKARRFLPRLYTYDPEEVSRHAYRDEAPVI